MLKKSGSTRSSTMKTLTQLSSFYVLGKVRGQLASGFAKIAGRSKQLPRKSAPSTLSLFTDEQLAFFEA